MRIPEDGAPREPCAIIARLEAHIAQLEAELAKARGNSSNSSKPPSSDIVKPPRPAPPKGESRRKIGGQPGHPRHERASFPPEQVDQVRTCKMRRCPKTGGRLRRAGLPPKTFQQIGLVEKPFVVRQHRAYACRCGRCNAIHWAPFRQDIQAGGLLDARATAFVAFLKGPCDASCSTIKTFLADHMGLAISRGQLARTVAKASEPLAAPYEEMALSLPDEPQVNVDETGQKDRSASRRPAPRRAPTRTGTPLRRAPTRGGRGPSAPVSSRSSGSSTRAAPPDEERWRGARDPPLANRVGMLASCGVPMKYLVAGVGFVLVWFGVAVICGLAMAILFPPKGPIAWAGIATDWRNLPGTILGFLAALQSARATLARWETPRRRLRRIPPREKE